MQKLTHADLQKYVNRRVSQRFRGRNISGPTVRKELVTFSQIWYWSKRRGYVKKDCPIYDGEKGRWALSIPKATEKPKFQTWAQIQRRVRRGGLTEQQENELWASLFLDEDQVAELLQFVQKQNTHPPSSIQCSSSLPTLVQDVEKSFDRKSKILISMPIN